MAAQAVKLWLKEIVLPVRTQHYSPMKVSLLIVLGVIWAGYLSALPNVAHAAGLTGKSGVFKVVKPPDRGARKRLIINNVTRSIPPGRSARAQRHAWFWRAASPRIDAADPARLEAMTAVAARQLSGGGRGKVVQDIGRTFGAEIATAARNAKVSEALLIALVAAESAGNPTAVSPKGAQGLGQLMPATARRFGVDDAKDPAQNLRGAADYLSLLLTLFKGDALLALAGYNAGEGAVSRHKGVPPYNETRDYVPIVLGYYHHAKRLCGTPVSGPRAECALTE